MAASLVFAFGPHVLGGVVPIGAAAPSDPPAPAAAVSESSDAQPASPVQVAIAQQTSSAWLTLSDDASSAPTEETANVVSSSVRAAPAAAATPGAVIPLPAAIYPALLTLGGAGWVAIRSRNGRRL